MKDKRPKFIIHFGKSIEESHVRSFHSTKPRYVLETLRSCGFKVWSIKRARRS